MVTSGRLETFLNKRPFVPARIVMSSGDRYEIRHPELEFLTRGYAWIGMRPDDKGIPDDAELCSQLHAVSLEPLKRARGRKPTRGRGRAA